MGATGLGLLAFAVLTHDPESVGSATESVVYGAFSLALLLAYAVLDHLSDTMRGQVVRKVRVERRREELRRAMARGDLDGIEESKRKVAAAELGFDDSPVFDEDSNSTS